MEQIKLSLSKTFGDWARGLVSNFFKLIGVLLIFIFLNAIGLITLAAFIPIKGIGVTPLFFVIIFVLALALIGLWLGYVKIALQIAKQGTTNIGQLFGAFRFISIYLGALIIFFSMLIGLIVLALIVGGAVSLIFLPLGILFGLALVVTIIYMAIRFSQFTFFILDGAGVFDSLSKSWQATHGSVIRLGLLYWIFSIFPLFGTLAEAGAYEQLRHNIK